MRFNDGIELYLRDTASQGRLTSPGSERAYRDTLYVLAREVSNRDPQTINRDDVKRVLRRWSHPNTQRKHRSVMVSFFDWSMEKGYRKDNPAAPDTTPKAPADGGLPADPR
jgi:site-specific recombinase XerD